MTAEKQRRVGEAIGRAKDELLHALRVAEEDLYADKMPTWSISRLGGIIGKLEAYQNKLMSMRAK